MSTNTIVISTEALREAIDLFYDGSTIDDLAADLGVTRGVMQGRLQRAAVGRYAKVAEPDRFFTKDDSLGFRRAMAAGLTYFEAGKVFGKIEGASRRHAEALGWLKSEDVIVPARALTKRAPPAPVIAVVEPGNHDDAHVAAVLAQGGFDRCDFETGWVVGMTGALRYPFTQAAADAARAQIAAHQAGQAA